MASSGRSGGWEALFWQAFENSRNAMVILDQDRVTVAINQAAVQLLGRTREEAIGRRGDLFIAPSGWRRIDSDWAVLLRDGRHFTSQEVLRPDGRQTWIEFAAIREVVTGRQLVLIVVLETRMRSPTDGGVGDQSRLLTPREVEVVTEIAMGRRVNEIAAALHIAPTTARTHVRNAMSKLGARSQGQLVAMTLAEGLLDADAVNRQIRR